MKKSFLITIESIQEALEWVEQKFHEQAPLIEKKMMLVAEEAIVNSLTHGYQEKQGVIEVSIEKTATHLILTIRDFAKASNPLEIAPLVDPLAPIEERKEGGLGIYLMKQLVDEISYRREDESNLLIFIKKLTP